MNNQVVVFDLDDTLYYEIDFLKSAYLEISNQISVLINKNSQSIYNEMLDNYNNGCNVFKALIHKYNLNFDIDFFINIYRNHKPDISLNIEKKELIEFLKSQSAVLGIITDGKSVQQRHKIEALGIDSYFDAIIISEEFGSEKPHINNYLYFQNKYPDKKYTYIGDNLSKDFISANALNWTTICLIDGGENIHKQNFEISQEYLPKHKIYNFTEIPNLINEVE